MLKRFFFIILLTQLLLIACSSFSNVGNNQGSLDKIKKTQEIAKISKDIYDIRNIIKKGEVNFSTISANFKVFGIKEYLSLAEIMTDLSSMTKALEDGDLSLAELEQYSKLTGILVHILDSPVNGTRSDYSAPAKLANHQGQKLKAVTLADVNAINNDSIEDFKLPEDTFLLAKLDLIDSLYYYENRLYTGIAYSSFENGQISEFKSIKHGALSGPSYAWYQDGSYAMQATFLEGYLSGRFIAWSEVGDIIYDIYFNKGQFKSDLQYERDSTRQEQDAETSEGEADSEGNSGE